MKIIFVCGSLEGGRDGVGDYTYRLATEIADRGNEVLLLSLNDKFIEDQWTGKLGENQINASRIPSSFPDKRRFSIFHDFINQQKPNWISLQYVGFSFQKYGLPINLILNLAKLNSTVNLHIMFHELWCGMARTAGKKEKILGAMQNASVRFMLTLVRFKSVFTSIKPYADRLNKLGVKPIIVPVFGNIPLETPYENVDWEKLDDKFDFENMKSNTKLVAGFFGSIYPCVGFEELLNNLWIAAEQMRKELVILIIGHGRGSELSEYFVDKKNVSFVKTGALEAGLVNKAMSHVDLGIITSPVDGINKSGGALAWMERGVPVLYSGEDNSAQASEMEIFGAFQVKTEQDIVKAFNAKSNLTVGAGVQRAGDSYIKAFGK